MKNKSLPAIEQPPRWNGWAAALVSAAVMLTALCAASIPFRAGANWFAFVQDDCFYYLKVAQNLATGHGSTFNGIAPTNGYHPLWLFTLACFRFLFPSASFIHFIIVCVIAATLSTYELTRRILRTALASPLVVNALAAFITAFSMQLFYTGMEVILAIPLVLLFLLVCLQFNPERHGAKYAFAMGLLVSAMVLARIDALLLPALLGVALLLHPRLRQRITRGHLIGLALGLLPLAGYLLSNQIIFHTWLPISGMAKQLKSGHLPSMRPWKSFYVGPVKHFVSFLPIVLSLPLLITLRPRLSDNEQILYPVVLVWPFLYILMISCVSDWMLWTWYFYPFRIALCVAFVLLLRWQPVTNMMRHPVMAVAVCLFAIARLSTARWTVGDMDTMVEIARDVQQFATTHPGVYAMGDRSGSVGYLLSQPLVQTEGLMMDRTFFESIRHAEPLRDTLASYNVRYYIGTEFSPYSPCFHAVEPSQAGPSSPHMTADFCGITPVAVFNQADSRTLIYELPAR